MNDDKADEAGSYSDILYNVADSVATIAINRPKKLNAFNGHTIDELRDAVARAGEDRAVGVIVLTGAGDKAFSAGGDIEWEVEGGLKGHDWKLGEDIISCLKPVIARVKGYAVGVAIISTISAISRSLRKTPFSGRTAPAWRRLREDMSSRISPAS